MSGPIKKGDLVMVVGGTPCCNDLRFVGQTWTVSWTGLLTGNCGCGKHWVGDGADWDDASEGGYPLSMLKKIDPPTTGEYDRVPVRKTQPRKVTA